MRDARFTALQPFTSRLTTGVAKHVWKVPQYPAAPSSITTTTTPLENSLKKSKPCYRYAGALFYLCSLANSGASSFPTFLDTTLRHQQTTLPELPKVTNCCYKRQSCVFLTHQGYQRYYYFFVLSTLSPHPAVAVFRSPLIQIVDAGGWAHQVEM